MKRSYRFLRKILKEIEAKDITDRPPTTLKKVQKLQKEKYEQMTRVNYEDNQIYAK